MSAPGETPRAKEAIVATGLTRWFGEGETNKVAVNEIMELRC
jgi:hypothetical protein